MVGLCLLGNVLCDFDMLYELGWAINRIIPSMGNLSGYLWVLGLGHWVIGTWTLIPMQL